MNNESDLKDKILFALSEEPNLTAEQLSLLTNAKLNTVQKALKRLQNRNLIIPKPIPIGFGTVLFWKLKGDKRKAVTEQSWKHERDCGDLYVALRKTGIPLTWIHTSDQKDGFRFDRALTIFDKQFYFEIERGTQTVSHIEQKVKQYMEKPGTFYVVITVQDYQPNPFEKTVKTGSDFGREILALLTQYKRRAQFTVTPHKALLTTPLSECLVSSEPAKYSLETIQ